MTGTALEPALGWCLPPGEDAWHGLSPAARRALLDPVTAARDGERPSHARIPEPLARELSAAGFLVRERTQEGVVLALDPLAEPFVRWLASVRSRASLAQDSQQESASPTAVGGGVETGSRPEEKPSPALAPLLELLADARGRTRARALARLFPRFGRPEVDRVRERLARTRVLFHDLDPATLDLEIGLSAPAREALSREPEPAPLEPLADRPADAFERPVFQEDVAALLLELARSPAKVKTGGGKKAWQANPSGVPLYEKARARVLEAFEDVPGWVVALGLDRDRRLDLALGTAVARGLAGLHEGELRLEDSGRAHLARPRAERLALFPVPVPAWKARLDETHYGIAASSIVLDADPDPRPGAPSRPREASSADRSALRSAVARCFASLETGRFFELDRFVKSACARGEAPLRRGAEPSRVQATLGLRVVPGEAGELERASRQLLRQLVTGPLAHVGGVALAPLGQGGFAFALAPLGRVYLGLEAALPEETAPAPAGAILQPNFDVVVLGPDPGLVAELLLVAEPAGGAAGDPARTFQLTRASVRAAVAAGLSAEAIVALLARVSRTGVPENVARSVRDWAGQVRRASLASGAVLVLPDQETLERVQAALGASARPLGHAVAVEGLSPGELRRRLEKLGVILG